MNIDFKNISDHIIPLSEFSMKWRFTEEKYNILPEIHLNQIEPLDKEGSSFLADYLSKIGLHANIPFKNNYFRTIDKARILEDNKQEIKKWLYHRGLPFDKKVYLNYNQDSSLIVPWKIFVKYFDDFYYSDDLTIFDESLQWAILFYHEDEIYFGSKKDYIPSNNYENIDFCW